MAEPPSPSLGARRGLLDLLDPQDRADLSAVGRLQRFPRGPIVRQGDPSDSVFVVLEGRVKISLDTADGRTVVLDVFGEGDLVGEFEALGDYATRAASVVALDPVACRVVTRQDFRDYLMAHPSAAIALVRLMIRRLGAADRRRIDGTAIASPRRLARFLLDVVGGDSSTTKDRIDVDVPLAQHELASLIGVSRNSMVRALTTLRARHLVTTTGGVITIPDPPALRRYIESERP